MIRDGLPSLGCRCRHCAAARRAIHARLSDAQRRAIEALDFVVPRHPTDLSRRDGIRPQTLELLALPAALRPALVRRCDLRSWPIEAAWIPFYCLTQHGDEVLSAIAYLERKRA